MTGLGRKLLVLNQNCRSRISGPLGSGGGGSDQTPEAVNVACRLPDVAHVVDTAPAATEHFILRDRRSCAARTLEGRPCAHLVNFRLTRSLFAEAMVQ